MELYAEFSFLSVDSAWAAAPCGSSMLCKQSKNDHQVIPPSAPSGAGKLVDDATSKCILSPKPSSYLLLSLSTVTSQ